MFRPCIDVKFQKVVQLEQGQRLALTDDRTPLELATIYEEDQLFGGHIIDLEGGKNKSVILPALCKANLQVGGGIRLDNGQEFLDAGATHLIFASAVFKKEGVDWDMLNQLREKFGKQRIVLAPDVKNDRFIYARQWTHNTGIKLDGPLLQKLADYCDELLIHSIEVEGMEGGIDRELVDFLSKHKTTTITYAGGGSNLDVVEELHQLGLDITIGKAYFAGHLSHNDLVALNRRLKSRL